MTYFESLDFVYRLVFERFDLPTWFWSILAVILSLVLVHWLWGLVWNARWGLFTRPGMAATSILLAVIAGASALTWLAAHRSAAWLDLQRTELPRRFADSGARNRAVLVAARDRIGPGPDENTLTLRTDQDLLVLAETAAASVRCTLTPSGTASGPLGYGAPCRVRDPASVARDLVRTIPAVSFPLQVSPDNPWTKAAVAAQVEEALSYATPLLRAGMAELATLAAVLFWSALALQAILVPIAAVGDIRVRPPV